MYNYSFDICWKYCIISGYSTSMVRNGKKILSINRNSKYLIEIGENNQDNVKQLEEKYKEERALFGEKYPAEMMHLMQIANYFYK